MEDHNCNLDASLANKGLGTARKCSYCHKTMFFKTYRCKHCRYKCHKKCASHSGSRRNSCQKTAGDEHWTKVLQASEVNANMVAMPCQSQHALQHAVCQCDRKKRKSRHASFSKSDKSFNKDTNIFSSLYARFVEWVAKTRNESSSRGHRDRTSSIASSYMSRSRSSSKASLDLVGYDILSLSSAQSPKEAHKLYHTSVSSEDSEYSSYMLTSYSSNCSSLTLTSTSTSASDFHHSCSENLLRGGNVSNATSCTSSQSSYYGYQQLFQSQECDLLTSQEDSVPISPPAPLPTFQPKPGLTGRQRLTSTTSFQPVRSGVRASWLQDDALEVNNPLCATWPPSGKKHSRVGQEGTEAGTQDYDLDLDGSVFGDYEEEQTERLTRTDLKEALGDCSISYSDLDLGQCVRVGRRHQIYRGRWHGDVMIHTYQDRTEEEVTEFLGEVSRMSMLRHENIALFMGACLEPPNLAVVTSDLKGKSLYDQIHLHNDRVSMHSRVNIARQVAQGMGYLHAKGIVLKKLNSKNVYLQPKVKICLIDYGMAEKKYDRPDYGCVSRGTLTYVAPELLRSLRIMGPKLEPSAPFTKTTDVFAFGTLLFELVSGHFPMLSTPPECLLWQVACGKRQHLHHLHCNATLKNLIQKCWCHLSEDRPTFYDINSRLQENTSLHKRHSTSNPERLHRLGTSCKNPF